MRREFLLDSLTDIDPQYIDEGGELLLGGAKRRPGARLITTVLIAAAIASLLTATAFAAGLFGLRERLSGGGILTLNGFSGSPEAQAADAWYDYRIEYVTRAIETGTYLADADDTSWLDGDAALLAAYANYGAWEKPMAEKLVGIVREYGLEMHTWSSQALTDADFADAAGLTGRMLLAEDMESYSGLIFEDGSFTRDVSLDGGTMYFSRCRPGMMPAWTPPVRNAEGFEEWSYTNAGGQRVMLAMNTQSVQENGAEMNIVLGIPDKMGEPYRACIFYEANGWHISAICTLASCPAREDIERLADGIDFSACSAGEINVDKYRYYTRHEARGAEGPDYKTLAAADELQAQKEFKEWYSDAYGQYAENYGRTYTPESMQRAALSSADEATADMLRAVCEKYSLTPPKTAEEPPRGITQEELMRAIGQEGFCTEELSVTEVYDTGAFIAAGARPVPFELHYMAKGSLYTGGWRIFFFLDDVGPVRGPETAESWMYVNAFGDTVCCVDAGCGSSLVIYETPQAYVMAISFGTERTDTAPGAAGGGDYAAERLADSIEFSKLK